MKESRKPVPGYAARPAPVSRPARARALSQNFLVDPGVAARIVETFAPTPADRVVEIGPGEGVLTEQVVGRAASLTAIELDRRLAGKLRRRFGSREGFSLIEGDVLLVSFAELAGEGRIRLLGNLPYHISSPIVLQLLEQTRWFSDALVMLQREFALRLVAAPGTKDYGSLSVLVQTRLDAVRLFDVPPRAFDPPPRVMSSVLALRPLATPLLPPELWGELKAGLRAAFRARRKTLQNALAQGLGLARDLVAERLKAQGQDPEQRPEQLDPACWCRLAAAGLFRI